MSAESNGVSALIEVMQVFAHKNVTIDRIFAQDFAVQKFISLF